MRALLILLALCAIGCGSYTETQEVKLAKPGDELVGQWFGRFELSEVDLQKASEVERRAAIRYFSNLKLNMTINADGTYEVHGGDMQSDGTWEVKDGKLHMTDASAAGTNAYKTQVFAIQKDGKVLVGKDPADKGNTLMVFEKA